MTKTIDLGKIKRTDLARETKSHVSHISRILNKKERPSIELGVRIAKSLDISMDDLCEALEIK